MITDVDVTQIRPRLDASLSKKSAVRSTFESGTNSQKRATVKSFIERAPSIARVFCRLIIHILLSNRGTFLLKISHGIACDIPSCITRMYYINIYVRLRIGASGIMHVRFRDLSRISHRAKSIKPDPGGTSSSSDRSIVKASE